MKVYAGILEFQKQVFLKRSLMIIINLLKVYYERREIKIQVDFRIVFLKNASQFRLGSYDTLINLKELPWPYMNKKHSLIKMSTTTKSKTVLDFQTCVP